MSPYGAYQMVFLFLCARVLGFVSIDAALVGLYLGAFAQLALIIRFILQCWRHSVAPEPFRNQPTANCAVTSIVGVALGMHPRHWLVSGSFIYTLVLVVFLVPPQVRTPPYTHPPNAGKDQSSQPRPSWPRPSEFADWTCLRPNLTGVPNDGVPRYSFTKQRRGHDAGSVQPDGAHLGRHAPWCAEVFELLLAIHVLGANSAPSAVYTN